jgi:hypothetical protein
MDGRRGRALSASLAAVAALGLAAAPAAFAAPGVSVSSVSSLKAGATAGTLSGTVTNDTGKARRSTVVVRLMRRGTDANAIGTTAVSVPAHGKSAYSVRVKLPKGLTKGNYYLSSCTQYGGRDHGKLGCATARDDVLVKGGIPVRGPGTSKALARISQAPTCSPGGRNLVHPGSRLYPESGNTGYSSQHTDINLIYDAPTNNFLTGTLPI